MLSASIGVARAAIDALTGAGEKPWVAGWIAIVVLRTKWLQASTVGTRV
jgi:hypothetical protein